MELQSEAAGAHLEGRITDLGRELGERLSKVLAGLPDRAQGPQALAKALGLDKVLTSRLLKATRNRDALAVAYHVPGTEPLRRFLRAARRNGVPAEDVAAADDAVGRFAAFVRQEVGDRSALDALISAWLPEARREFELRRKQAAYKAMSQLKGASADLRIGTAVLHPSRDGERLDLVWVFGMFGLTRLRPGSRVTLSTRRMGPDAKGRRPTSLAGEAVEELVGLRLDQFCDAPAPLEVHHYDDEVHYALGESGFGPHSAVDIVLAEANVAELPRYMPPEIGRKAYFFSSVSTPSKALHLDVLLHDDVYPGAEPELRIYDMGFDGAADPNDRRRDKDRLELAEEVQRLGRGASGFRSAGIPRYADLVRHVFDAMGWEGERFRGFRCRVDYPIYGSQYVLAFDPPPPPQGVRAENPPAGGLDGDGRA